MDTVLNGSEKEIGKANKIRARVLEMLAASKPELGEDGHLAERTAEWISTVESAKFFVSTETYITCDACTLIGAIMTHAGQQDFAKRCRLSKVTIPAFPTPVR